MFTNSVFPRLCRWLSLGLAAASCNHLFYYPDAYYYDDPARENVLYENLVWTNPENLKLQVLEMFPSSAYEHERGTIVHLHGNAQNRSSHYHFSYWLTNHGYRVFVPDYRGYGGSEGKPSREGLVSDAQFFIRTVCERVQGPVYVFGQSLGGAVAVPALAKMNSSCIRGLIIESSFSSYRAIARDKLASFWLSWLFQYPLSFLVSDDASPVDYAGAVSVPTLMIHGEADPVVPIDFGKKLYNAFVVPDKDFWTVPHGGHTSGFVSEAGPFKERLVEWLERHSLE